MLLITFRMQVRRPQSKMPHGQLETSINMEQAGIIRDAPCGDQVQRGVGGGVGRKALPHFDQNDVADG